MTLPANEPDGAGATAPAPAQQPQPRPVHDDSLTWLVRPWLLLAALLLLLVPADNPLLSLGRATHAFHYRPRLRGAAAASQPPLFLVYGNIPLYWGSYVVKEFITVVANLTGHMDLLVGGGGGGGGKDGGSAQPVVWKTYYPADGHPGLDGHPSWDQLAWDCIVDYGRVPDVILFLQDFALFNRPRKGTMMEYDPAKGSGPVFMDWFDDINRVPSPDMGPQLAGVDILLPTYEYLLHERLPAVEGTARVWMPHSAMPSFILPPHPSPKAQVLLVGSVYPDGYPLRWAVFQRIERGDGRFARFDHPGWQPGQSTDHQRDMALATQGYLAAIADGSNGNYVVGKCLEIPATGTLLLMSRDIAGPMAALGFANGTHYLAYDIDSLDAVVDWVLAPANRAAVDAMRAAGQAVAQGRHQTHMRTQLILDTAMEVFRKRGRPQAEWTLPQPFPAVKEWGPWASSEPWRPAERHLQTEQRAEG